MKHRVAALLVMLCMSSCGRDRAAPADAGKPRSAVKAKSSTTSTRPAPGPAWLQSIGVPECDSYFQRYHACLKHKVPPASRQAMERPLLETWKEWKKALAEDPAGKKDLQKACQTASEAAAAAMKSLGCAW